MVAAGGDGLASEVARGLLSAPAEGDRPAFGLLPLGTGNDLARALGIPTGDLPAAAAIVARGRARSLDAGRLEDGTLFLSAAVAGFGGRLRPGPRTRRRWGRLSYVREAARALPRLRPHRALLTLEGPGGVERLEERLYTLAVCNGPYAGGGLPLAPGARNDDGLLDVVGLRVAPVPALAVLIARVVAGRHLGTPGVLHRRVRGLRVRSVPTPWVNVDGEPRRARDLSVESVPAALRVLAPDPRPDGDGSPP